MVRENMLNLRGFLHSFHTYGIYAFKDLIIRRVIAPLSSLTHDRRLPKLLECIKTLTPTSERFLLIILDSCRYDVFSIFAPKFFIGHVRMVRSEGSFLPDWVPLFLKTISCKGPVRIFRAICKIKPHDLRLVNFCANIKGVEIVEVEPKNGLVAQPQEVNESVLKFGLAAKNVVWYMQPHFPWTLCPEITSKLLRLFMMYEFISPSLAGKLAEYAVNREQVTRCYIKNLLLVLKEVYKLLSTLNKEYNIFSGYKVVMSADHGELLGEYGMYFHPPGYKLPQLTIVPWMEIHDLA